MSTPPVVPPVVPLVVAVDGTSGSGKSSTSKGAADRLGLRYLDTGAQFRAMTWAMLSRGVDVHDADAVATTARQIVIGSGTDPLAPTITLDGVDVSVEIRSDEVNASVSPVATVPAVRTLLLELQRSIITEALNGAGIVVEGRDIGSVVWPQAELKLYVSADPAARAARRALEAGGDVAATQASLEARDVIDSGRATAPLIAADGAFHLDTTHITLAQAIDQVIELVEQTRATVAEGSPA